MSELRGELRGRGRDVAVTDARASLRRAAAADTVASAGDPTTQRLEFETFQNISLGLLSIKYRYFIQESLNQVLKVFIMI